MSKNWYILFIVLIIIILWYLINYAFYYNTLNTEYLENISSNTLANQIKYLSDNKYKFPYRYLKNEYNQIVPIVALTGFFRSNDDKESYYKYRELGIPVIGITAYKTFPLKIRDVSEDKFHITDNFDYVNNIKVWLTCMNNLDRYGFTESNVLFNMSESDFYDGEENYNHKKIYDYIYICNKDHQTCPKYGWNAINRNYDLALRCLPILAGEYKLKGLWVGRIGCNISDYKDYIDTTDFLPYQTLQAKMRQSRFLFLPNIYDASPRVISECLIKNVPVLMNRAIICGFKYINENTGEFFTDEHDIRNGLDKILYKLNNNMYNIPVWWNNNYGYKNSSLLLRNYLYKYYPLQLEGAKYVSLVI